MSEPTPTPPATASRAMATFQCLREECEDNCCSVGWSIPYEAEPFARLQAAMSSVEERAELIRTIRINRHPEPNQPVAVIATEPHSSCGFLEPAGLCSVHHRHGEDVLSNMCASYPRVLGRVGAQVTMHGFLSCPEVVRQTLLVPDGTALVAAPPESLGRGQPHRVLDASETDGYRRSFPPVNNLLLGFARLTQAPLRTRLFFLAVFADRTRATMSSNNPDFDGPELMQLIRGMAQPEVLARLHEELEGLAGDTLVGMSVVRGVLAQPPLVVSPKLAWLMSLIAPVYDAKNAPIQGDVAAVAAAYDALAASLSPSVAERIDELLGRYVVDHLQRDWFIRQKSLIDYTMGLLARIATLRFLLVSHPLVAANGAGDIAAIEAELDVVFVDAVYSLARTLDHSPAAMRELLDKLAQADVMRLSDLVALLKF